ncbi:MAG TPA: SAM-dependent methyltransferase [Gaiellaceae bacterium]|nr:SAM-dependent methyltransferase [Gaiellaceae bacterium]
MPSRRKSTARSAGAGSLTVVGTGIQLVAHVTHEARAELEAADEVLYVVADPAVAVWLERVNPKARSLGGLYEPGRNRHEIYDAMVEEILAAVRRGSRVCAAFYGHPGVFVSPSHEAIRIARDEGYAARMLAAVSAEDCLFADLGINPGERGCQSYEATEFLVHRHVVDPTAALLLWQVDLIGQVDFRPEPGVEGLRVLVESLLGSYPAEHEVVLYTASPYPLFGPSVVRVPLSKLAEVELVPMPTLYVPPLPAPPLDPELLDRLGMARVTAS